MSTQIPLPVWNIQSGRANSYYVKVDTEIEPDITELLPVLMEIRDRYNPTSRFYVQIEATVVEDEGDTLLHFFVNEEQSNQMPYRALSADFKFGDLFYKVPVQVYGRATLPETTFT